MIHVLICYFFDVYLKNDFIQFIKVRVFWL
jgi:hypothetical protein